MKIKIELYGRLQHEFGQRHFEWQTHSYNIKHIYLELCEAFDRPDESHVIRPIIDDAFCNWESNVSAANVIGYLPPASGG